jgi:hypothetical protein
VVCFGSLLFMRPIPSPRPSGLPLRSEESARRSSETLARSPKHYGARKPGLTSGSHLSDSSVSTHGELSEAPQPPLSALIVSLRRRFGVPSPSVSSATTPRCGTVDDPVTSHLGDTDLYHAQEGERSAHSSPMDPLIASLRRKYGGPIPSVSSATPPRWGTVDDPVTSHHGGTDLYHAQEGERSAHFSPMDPLLRSLCGGVLSVHSSSAPILPLQRTLADVRAMLHYGEAYSTHAPQAKRHAQPNLFVDLSKRGCERNTACHPCAIAHLDDR